MELFNRTLDNEHFSYDLWVDFVRGGADKSVQASMQAHLDSACQACSAVFNWLDRFARFGAAESGWAVPENLVQAAKDTFDPTVQPDLTDRPDRLNPPGLMDAWQSIAAKLIHQTGLSWQPVGVRAAGAGFTSGRMLFRAGDYLVDLQMDPASPGNPHEIIGQIANEHERSEVLDGILVEMVIPGRTLVETATNRFGEFVIECPHVPSAILRFGLKHRKQRIELPLKMRG